MMTLWLLIALGSGLAGFTQGLAGFGFGLVSLAVWSWVVEPAVAVPLVVFGSLLGQILAIGSLRDGFSFRLFFPFLLGGIVGIPTGLWLLGHADPLLFKFGVGLLLTLYCTTMLYIASIPPITWGGRVADALVGWVGGTMSGFGGMPAPAPTLWCTLRGWPKDQQRTVFQAFNLFMHMLTFSAFLVQGMITPEISHLFLIVAPCMLIPTLVGIRLYRRFTNSSFKGLVMGLLAASGAMLMVSTGPEILRLYF